MPRWIARYPFGNARWQHGRHGILTWQADICMWSRQSSIGVVEQEEREKLLKRIKARPGTEECANGVAALEAGEIMAAALTRGSKQ